MRSVAFEAILHHFRNQNFGIVVAFARFISESACLMQKTGNAGHCEGAKQRKLQRALDIPCEIEGRQPQHDLFGITGATHWI